jgi:hypothetical protein
MGIPIMEYQHQRKELVDWAQKQGESGLKKYWEKKNTVSLDGLPHKFD